VFRIRTLGSVPYHEAFALQHAMAQGSDDDYLLVLQHPHVFTLGARADRAHVLTDPDSVGATLEQTDRGGDVTYHGPGQLVAYPIVSVPDDPSAGPAHVHRLEEVVIATLADIGLPGATCAAEYPGVWIDADGPSPRKIAAIGVRTIRGDSGLRRTLHGVALNVDCDLAMFDHIVPCGIADRAVTSLRAERLDVSYATVVEAFIARATEMFAVSPVDRQDVVTGSTEAGSDGRVSIERPLIRRLRQAGVSPESGLQISQRKPEWLRVPVRMGKEYLSLGKTVHDLGLATVCEEAGCPNIFECWEDREATFLIGGDQCTRRCDFCQIATGKPEPLDTDEPRRVAESVAAMGLRYATVTGVARDDLPDGGAWLYGQTCREIHAAVPGCGVELLIPDFNAIPEQLGEVFAARPEVLAHNIETVPRIFRRIRPGFRYERSLGVLSRSREAGLITKSNLILGMGEERAEVSAAMADLRAAGCDLLTITQYLRPSVRHHPVARWVPPEEFDELGEEARQLGFAGVMAGPLVRSSYRAGRLYRQAVSRQAPA
jgi:lipoic acid synthetase